jgi:DNA-binding Xre family transcriptional regulator
MSQSTLLVQALKQLLKSQNITYQAVSKHLSLSEASVKRMFANAQLSLERIDSICELLGIEISDLLQKMQHMSKRIMQLTLEQEKIIVSNRKLCLVTICVVNRWTLDEILAHYNLNESECIQLLAELDKIKFIELLPKNKIKLLISPGFNWLPNGPIQKFFQQYILTDFISSNFHGKHEEMICQFGMLTVESNALLRKKMRHLADEFLVLAQQDAGEAIDKRVGSACVLMIRPWTPAIFNAFVQSDSAGTSQT